MNPIVWLIYQLLNIYFWIIVIMVIVSLLLNFNIVNRHNPYVPQIHYALVRLTEPVLGPIRRLLPDLGGIDVSPIIAAVLIQFLQYALIYYTAGVF